MFISLKGGPVLFEKLHAYYKKSLLLKQKPNLQFYSNYHWFVNEVGEWIGIPIEGIDNEELRLLKNLFSYENSPFQMNPIQKKWHDFLFLKSDVLPGDRNFKYRTISFKISEADWETHEIEEAVNGFIDTDYIILWETKKQGVLIVLNSDEFNPDEEILSSLSQTLESDFYVKSYFFYGKLRSLSKECAKEFQENQILFKNALTLMPSERVFTFEKCFPSLVASNFTANIKEFIHTQILDPISEEPELITTIRRYLENHLNATLTAKQLYIHRNTLQYRLDKFMDITGINLKDFNHAITVYLACLIYIQDEDKVDE